MRVLSFVSAVLAASPLVSAIKFEAPSANSTLSKGLSYSVKWSSVDTDPTIFSLYLVNFVNWPPFYTEIASNISTSSGALDVTIPCAVDNSWGYQFNAINGTNVYVIHAQTPRFYVSGRCPDKIVHEEKPLDPIPTDTLKDKPESCKAVTVTATETATVTLGPAAEATCASGAEPATVTVTAIATTVVTISPGGSTETLSCVAVPTSTLNSLPQESAPGIVGSPAAPEENHPEQPATTAAPTPNWEEGSSEPAVQTVYSTKYIDLSEVQDGQCAC